jgi:hypothetical protein
MNAYNEVKSSKTSSNVACRYDARQARQSGINYSRPNRNS